MSSLSGGWCWSKAPSWSRPCRGATSTLDPSHEPAGTHRAPGIEPLLDPAHETLGVADRAPHVHLALELQRRLERHQGPGAPGASCACASTCAASPARSGRSTSRKAAVKELARGCRRKVTSAIRPSVPSDPEKSLPRS